MRNIFGPRTSLVLRLLTDVSAMTAADVEAVASAWCCAGNARRAMAHGKVMHGADQETRNACHQVAEVVRRYALSTAIALRAEHIAFSAAAHDAATAVGAGPRHLRDCQVLIAPMASRIPWLGTPERWTS
jgi:hypothetical protein